MLIERRSSVTQNNNEKIKVDHITKIFGPHVRKAQELLSKGEDKAHILDETGSTVGVDNATFSIKNNEIFVIMGLSGSGKSTMLRMFNRLIDPTSGAIYLDGKDIMKFDKKQLLDLRRKKMSMVFQGFGLLPNRTILENAAFGLEVQDVKKEERDKKAHESLEMVGLHGYDDSYPGELSGGMQQRVGLARAITNDPDILLMDEAFSALDPLNRREMQNELLELQRKLHKTIIFISHDLNEALRVGDRIMMMHDGDVIQVDTPEDLLDHPKNEYVKKFIENVDRSKILTASNVMVKPNTVNIDKDGPKLALRRMKEDQISSIFVVDSDNHFVGIVDADDANEMIDKNEKDLHTALKTDVPTTAPNTPIGELFNAISKSPIPYAVVDDEKHLQGIILRSAVLDAMATKGADD
ncbi:glycine betaine/L-proline ABC transporter ATP-binding protein [Fructilactobacillus fructivorans]|uniref:quaternary amine ABC transporter ATP-binding protein n=1 Tax=Fructilactobacillus fructivorans TaxID=1614 RepID=UPI00068F37D7|nr:glycine betaine/L-proline ABC transporter ATP-binding protein [Fructilactobacillus fructivorans]MCT0151640.1 glycine betaine/L-proline ABC transporter ATP-binding protein [Fructilactobacillus fructivorans]MCT2867231.1 glycine betaine/L-proline ABC transporter ATP-binding protein [Fructilactobacillus fructivorans]MCT2868208.1 glycine betaine/L-proline ABC transporter ATP-binding protein [Fructilactobacillus fructivorans]MCT2872916.1 glycine betaine/L-proline ABC transporter ATP-binding protei